MSDCELFLNALAGPTLPADERLMLCGFEGDPGHAPPHAWRPRPWRPGADINLDRPMNGYVAVSSFRRGADGSWRRRIDSFAAGLALMIDDVGTKVDGAIVAKVPPSAVIETSEGNFQWWYFIQHERDRPKFDRVIRGFIYSSLLGNDPGMNGVNRVGRLPGFLNGKPKAKGWRVVMHDLWRDRRYRVDDLVKAFNIPMLGTLQQDMPGRRLVDSEERRLRVHNFGAMLMRLAQLGALKATTPDPSGWLEMTCPWVENHTDAVNNGAALRIPKDENGFWGGFKCHHGGCAERGLADVSDWLDEINVAAAEEANA